MYKRYLYSALVVIVANNSVCMDNPHPQQKPQEYFGLHYDNRLKQHQVFCDENKGRLVEKLFAYHVEDARCSCAQQQRSFLATNTNPAVKQNFMDQINDGIVIRPHELTPERSLCLLEPAACSKGIYYILFFGSSEKEVMQKYFKSRIERGVYKVDHLKQVLLDGTQEQCADTGGLQSASLRCPTVSCNYEVSMQGVEHSFKPLLRELFRHFALCYLVSNPHHEEYKTIARRIGGSFLEARDKLGKGK